MATAKGCKAGQARDETSELGSSAGQLRLGATAYLQDGVGEAGVAQVAEAHTPLQAEDQRVCLKWMWHAVLIRDTSARLQEACQHGHRQSMMQPPPPPLQHCIVQSTHLPSSCN